MANMLFTNNAATLLASSISSSATSLTVTTGGGVLFPNPTGSQYFYCTLASSTTSAIEIVKVTARSTDTFTIVRGQDGTTGTAFVTGDKVELRLVAASLNDFPKLDEANTFTGANAYGTPASLVLTNATGLPVAGGGTGSSTLTANNVLLGNGTSALQVVAPSTSGNVLTSNGTTWTSSAPVVGVFGQAFTSNGTFTIPAGVTAVKVSIVSGGGGGGGGAFSGATSGGSGGSSSFGSYVVTGASGGGAGSSNQSAGTHTGANGTSGSITGGTPYVLASITGRGNAGIGGFNATLICCGAASSNNQGGYGASTGTVGYVTGLTPGGSVTVTVGAAGTAGSPNGTAGTAGFVLIEW